MACVGFHGRSFGPSFFSVTCLIAVAFSPAAFAGPAKQPRVDESVPGQFVVQLAQPISALPAFLQTYAIHSLGGAVVDHVRDDMVLIQREPAESRVKALRALNENAYVKVADPNYIYHASKTPNDPKFGDLWGMSNSGHIDTQGTRGLPGVDINAEKAWDITTGSKDVVVAVIDTGVDFTIPDLKDNAWTNIAELNGQPAVDDDSNGYVDDIHGFNFVANNGDVKDDAGHGSHCSGTIGARGDDGVGVAGVNWNVSIMAVKFLDATGGGSLANAIKAIDYARKNGAKIMSNSWGGGAFTDTLLKSIQDTRDAGVLFVAAAGNDGNDNDANPTYPASYAVENILAVAAVGNRGALADFSNYGANTVHIAAPGVNILSTVPNAAGFDTYSGTSMATPHVSGVAALVLAANPTMTAAQLKERLISSSRPLKILNGKIKGGMLDAFLALTGTAPPADPNDPSVWTSTKAYVLSSPHPYLEKYKQVYTITIPGAKRISAHFAKFDTEANYDKLTFVNPSAESLGAMSGQNDGKFSPIAEGDTLTFTFQSDDSINGYGFDIDSVSYVE